MEVGTIEREEWRSVETNNGEQCVMMSGIKMTPLLCADNLDFQKKVLYNWTYSDCLNNFMSVLTKYY